MTISNRTLVVVAFSVLGLTGWKAQDPIRQGDADEPAAIDGAAVPGDPAATPQQPQLVLLTDGRIIAGVVSEDEGKILVTQPVGVMRFPEKKIERIFASLKEVHKYKSNQVPELDIDEQLKLAQWCLTNGLAAEARGHLRAVLNLDPKNLRAKAMTTSIDMGETRLAKRQRDAEVQQTSGEVVDPTPIDDRPATLDSAVVRGARRGMGVSDLPVVFDLPPNAAIRRAEEFNRYVHPVLQTYCAKCHDDRYDGAFKLIHFKKKTDRTQESFRANLDATLRLVDRENPGRSELLASSLRPHGQGPNTRPIFQGSNDRGYQILSAWVNNLRVKPTTGSPASEAPSEAGSTEPFAADRTRISQSAVDYAPLVGGPAVGEPVKTRRIDVPPMRYTPGTGWVGDEGADPNDAPIPFAVSGVRPNLAPRGGLPAQAGQQPSPTSKPKTTIPPPNTIPQAEDDDDEAGITLPPPAPAATKPSKPLKFDPELLQRALQLKNGNR